jgi:hypothetical protein
MIIIIFPHDWPHKSPTLLQLLEDINKSKLQYELFLPIKAKKYWSFYTAKYFNIRLNILTRIAIRILNLSSNFDSFLINYIAKNILNKEINIKEGHTLICFDFFFYRTLIRKYNFKKKYIFSTELFLYFKNIFRYLNHEEVLLVTQSKVRADFLGLRSSLNLRLLDNIKLDREFLPSIKQLNSQNRNGLLYSGTICKELGEKAIEKLAIDPTRSYRFTIHGDTKINKNQGQKLDIIKKYLSDLDIRELMLRSKVGLVLYDFNHISRTRYFNFETGPSGKLLKYILCGLPVIGTECIGLYDVQKFKAGILLTNPTSKEINAAYQKIIHNYDFYKSGVSKFSSEILNRGKLIDFIK